MLAVRYGHVAAAEALIRAGADVNATLDVSTYRQPDRTALSIARVRNDPDLIRLLEEVGAVDPAP